MDDEVFYAQVEAETAEGRFMPGLRAKAYVEADGNEDATRAIYIRLRVEQLKKEAAKLAAAAVEREAEAQAAARVAPTAAANAAESPAERKTRKRREDHAAASWFLAALLLIVAYVAYTAGWRRVPWIAPLIAVWLVVTAGKPKR